MTKSSGLCPLCWIHQLCIPCKSCPQFGRYFASEGRGVLEPIPEKEREGTTYFLGGVSMGTGTPTSSSKATV